jgi:hypothetical protein
MKHYNWSFESWENPPLRRMGTAIPGHFKAIVQTIPEERLEGLFKQVLEQPVNRKGRYLALDILLPYMHITGIGDTKELSVNGKPLPIESFLEGIGDQGPNAGPIADLWIKILRFMWVEISKRNESSDEDERRTQYGIWKLCCIPSLSKAIIHPSLVRRRQVNAFCLPRVVD